MIRHFGCSSCFLDILIAVIFYLFKGHGKNFWLPCSRDFPSFLIFVVLFMFFPKVYVSLSFGFFFVSNIVKVVCHCSFSVFMSQSSVITCGFSNCKLFLVAVVLYNVRSFLHIVVVYM